MEEKIEAEISEFSYQKKRRLAIYREIGISDLRVRLRSRNF